MRRIALLLLLLPALLAGCGDDDDGAAASPTATAMQESVSGGGGGALDEDALLAVHDQLYECLRQADAGVLASYSNGQASVAESVEQPEFDADLAAPEEEAKLLDAGKASYIGIRANTRKPSGRGTPDWDVLIFPSEDAATEAAPALEDEAGAAEADGVFVRVEKKAGGGAAGDRAEAALAKCEDQAHSAG